MKEPLRKSLLDVGKGVLTAVLVAAILALPIKAAIEWGFRKWQHYREAQAYPSVWLEVQVPVPATGKSGFFTVCTIKPGSTVQFDGYGLQGTNPHQPFRFIAHVPAEQQGQPTVSQVVGAGSNASNNFNLTMEPPGTLRVGLQTQSLAAPRIFFFEPLVLAGASPIK